MGTPAHTARTTPGGAKNNDGYQTFLAFALDPDISVWEKSVQLPGIEGGDPIDTTTMHNATWRTKVMRALKEMTEFTITAAYAGATSLNQLNAIINQEGAITVHVSNGTRISFFGALRSATPQDVAEGEQPEIQLTITPTMTDPADGSEAGFNYSASAGT